MSYLRKQQGDGPVAAAIKYLTKQIDQLIKTVSASGGGGGGSVDITAIGGNAVTTTLPVSGTVSVTGVATAANQATEISSLSTIAAKDLLITGTNTPTLGNNILNSVAGSGSIDISGYKAIAIQIIPTGTVSSGVVTFEGSNDGTTFVAIPLYDEASLTANPISTVSPATGVNRYFLGPVHWRFFRARISTVIGGGGSVAGVAMLSKEPFFPDILTVTQATGANLNVAVASGTVTTVSTVTAVTNLNGGQTAHSAASTGNPLRVGGRVSPTTIATQDTTLVAGDASEIAITTAMQQVTKANAASELDYNFPLISVASTVTLQPLVLASGTASIRNYISSLTVQSDAIGTAGSAWILDGQGAIGTSVTIATPGVFTSTAHDLKVGDAIVFTSLGTITGISTNTIYYITATSFAATTFTVATAPGGTALQITGSTSAFTFYRVLQQLRFQTTGVPTPMQLNFTQPLRSIANGAINFFIPTTMTSGNIYITANGYRGF